MNVVFLFRWFHCYDDDHDDHDDDYDDDYDDDIDDYDDNNEGCLIDDTVTTLQAELENGVIVEAYCEECGEDVDINEFSTLSKCPNCDRVVVGRSFVQAWREWWACWIVLSLSPLGLQPQPDGLK